MLRKLNRRKTVRKGFSSDELYQRILLDKASFQEKKVFVNNKFARKYFDDDLLCNMLIQKDKFLMNKLTGYQTKRLMPFYPSYIPLIDANIVLSKDEYYWTANTIKYNCIRCGEPTISFLGDFKLKNVLCGKCVEDHYINKKGAFDKRLHDHEYSKFKQDFYTINKEHQKKLFSKLIKREKSLYDTDKSVDKRLKVSYTAKLKNIEKVYNSIVT